MTHNFIGELWKNWTAGGYESLMPRWRKSIRSLAVRVLDMPQDLVLDVPRITLMGKVQLSIENHRGVDLFRSDMLRLRLSEGLLEVEGEGLIIHRILKDEVQIEGVIRRVEFVS
jgi:sporulation protein YqfC